MSTRSRAVPPPEEARPATEKLSEAQVKSLSVPQLRAELEKRGLETTGLKPVLVARLGEWFPRAAVPGPGEVDGPDVPDDSVQPVDVVPCPPVGSSGDRKAVRITCRSWRVEWVQGWLCLSAGLCARRRTRFRYSPTP